VLEGIDPPELATPETYSQVVVATGSRLVFVAGQVAEDEHGNLVGAGDLAAQSTWLSPRWGARLPLGVPPPTR
jgi:enamine deaminase RidA (YjgF/YER057c/UK114 family)